MQKLQRGRLSVVLLVCCLPGFLTEPHMATNLPAPHSNSSPRPDRPLRKIVEALGSHSTQSGFRLLPTPSFSMHARLELVRRAVNTIDVQYYLVANDSVGRKFLRALRDAARRGVKVRILLDDLHTVGSDKLLRGLAAEPNIELRLFNPFRSARSSFSTRMLTSLFSVRQLNLRMHSPSGATASWQFRRRLEIEVLPDPFQP